MARGVTLSSRKMGMHEWPTRTNTTAWSGVWCRMWDSSSASKKINIEVELGFSAEEAALEVQRCLNCDVQTVFAAKLCIECDAASTFSGGLPHHYAERPGAGAACPP